MRLLQELLNSTKVLPCHTFLLVHVGHSQKYFPLMFNFKENQKVTSKTTQYYLGTPHHSNLGSREISLFKLTTCNWIMMPIWLITTIRKTSHIHNDLPGGLLNDTVKNVIAPIITRLRTPSHRKSAFHLMDLIICSTK